MTLEKETSIYQLGAIAAGIGEAVNIAESKNSIFHQATEPPTSGRKVGDIWYDSDDGFAMYKFDGTGWTQEQFGTNAISAGSVTAARLDAQDVYTNFLRVYFLSAAQAEIESLSAITANLGSVNVGGFNNEDGIITMKNASDATMGWWDNTGLHANAGAIGPWIIGSTGIYNGKPTFSSNANGAYVGIDGIKLEDADSVKEIATSGGIYLKEKTNGGLSTFLNMESYDGFDGTFTPSFVDVRNTTTNDYVSISCGTNWAFGVNISLRDTNYNWGIGIGDINGCIAFNHPADAPLITNYYNSTVYNVLRNHNNGNISISASGGGVYLGYENTTGIDFLNGKATISSTGNGAFQGTVTTVGGVGVYAPNATSSAWVACYGAGTNANNQIYIQAETDGQVTLGSRSNDGSWRTILKRANNSANITTWGNWYFSNWIVANTGIVSVLPNYTIGTNPSREMSSAHWFVDKSTNTSNALAAVFGGVGTNGMQYALLRVYNASTSSHTSAQLALFYPKNGTPYASLGCYLDVSGNIYAIHSGDAQVVAGNSKTGNRAYVFANGNTGEAGIYSFSADGTARPIIIRANNSNAITAYGTWTFNTGIKGNNNFVGIPVLTESSGTTRISYMASASGYVLRVNALWGGSTFATASATFTSSDIRLKENIKNSTVKAMPIVDAINIREFDWKDGRHQSIGFIADELEELDERLSIGGGTNDDGTMNIKSVDTFYLLGYAIKAIQELSAEVKKLKGVA